MPRSAVRTVGCVLLARDPLRGIEAMKTFRELVRSFPLRLSELLLVFGSMLPLGWVAYWSYHRIYLPQHLEQMRQEVQRSA